MSVINAAIKFIFVLYFQFSSTQIFAPYCTILNIIWILGNIQRDRFLLIVRFLRKTRKFGALAYVIAFSRCKDL